jgi:hypothetical protein
MQHATVDKPRTAPASKTKGIGLAWGDPKITLDETTTNRGGKAKIESSPGSQGFLKRALRGNHH